jgi:hypothetical protein
MPIEQPDIPIGMEKVHGRFERWRNSHTGRKRIPESLWRAAAKVAREHGIFRASKILRLDFNKLKQRVHSSGGNAGAVAAPAFVELLAPESAGLPEYVMELEGPRGKMRVRWKGVTPPDLAGLGRTLGEREDCKCRSQCPQCEGLPVRIGGRISSQNDFDG